MLRQLRSRLFRKSAGTSRDFRFRPKLERLETRDLPSASSIQLLEGTVLQTPTDPHYDSTWGLAKISAPSAWDYTTGSPNVVVASIDTGVDYTHPDLYLNIWLNPGEVPQEVKDLKASLGGTGEVTFRDLNQIDSSSQWVYGSFVSDVNGNSYIDAGDLLTLSTWNNGDSDANGYVDDLIGWNFVNNTNDPWDDRGHGTHTAGTIGALGNNGIGVAGVSWDVQIMPLKFIGANGSGTLSGAANAIRYAANEGAQVSNNSWGYEYGYAGDIVYNAINYARSKNHLVVASAGNDGLNNDSSRYRNYPASFTLANIISVAATTSSDAKASWSNYGKSSVDLGAPGVSILSTLPGGDYGYKSGTSMAAPHVTGTAALLLSVNPNLSYTSLKNAILKGVDKVSSMSKTVSGGRLNAVKALTLSAGGTLSLNGDTGASGGSTSGGGSSGRVRTKAIDFTDAEPETIGSEEQSRPQPVAISFFIPERQGSNSKTPVLPSSVEAGAVLSVSSTNANQPGTRGRGLISSSGAGSPGYQGMEAIAETSTENQRPASTGETAPRTSESHLPRQRVHLPEQGNQAAPAPQIPASPALDALDALFSEETGDVQTGKDNPLSALPSKLLSGERNLEAAMVCLFSFLGGCRIAAEKEKNRKNLLKLSA